MWSCLPFLISSMYLSFFPFLSTMPFCFNLFFLPSLSGQAWLGWSSYICVGSLLCTVVFEVRGRAWAGWLVGARGWGRDRFLRWGNEGLERGGEGMREGGRGGGGFMWKSSV